MYTVELCSGLAAWTLSLFDQRPPASRIGSKTGYAHAISRVLGVDQEPARAILVDSDPLLCNALDFLLHDPTHWLSCVVKQQFANEDPVTTWRRARDYIAQSTARDVTTAAMWWIWTAGARGGIGGFKGRHCRRPNVDGFIPSRASLVERIRAFRPLPQVEVVCADVRDVEPVLGAVVYVDPPYTGCQEYKSALDLEALRQVAHRWLQAGCVVAVSERGPIWWPGWMHHDITHERKGQGRRSLTRSTQEWLTMALTGFEPAFSA